jgi:hypothetical protein
MKKILLAVALLLLAVTATNAASPARKGGHRRAQTVQRTRQTATRQAPRTAAATTAGQSVRAGGLPSQAAAPLRLDATSGGTFNTSIAPQPGVGAIANLPPGSVTTDVPVAIIDAPGGGLIGVSGAVGSPSPFVQFKAVGPAAPNK